MIELRCFLEDDMSKENSIEASSQRKVNKFDSPFIVEEIQKIDEILKESFIVEEPSIRVDTYQKMRSFLSPVTENINE